MSSELPSQTILSAQLGDHFPGRGIVQGIVREVHAAMGVPIEIGFVRHASKRNPDERDIHVDFSQGEGSCIITVTLGIESALIDKVREALEKQLGLQQVEEVHGGSY